MRYNETDIMNKITVRAFAVLMVAAGLSAQRPMQYPPAWDQFAVDQFADARRVCLTRLGAGPARPAEVVILEIMPDAKSLSPLFQRPLVTELTWWGVCSVSGGRFLITFNDRFLPGSPGQLSVGRAPNAIVIYDLVRGTHTALSEDRFLAPDVLRRDPGPEGIYGLRDLWLDPKQDRLYISDAKFARDNDLPYLVIDLPSMQILTVPTPSAEVEAKMHSQMVRVDVYKPYWWDWSPGSEPGPDWSTPQQVPLYLKAEPARSEGVPAAGGDETLYFKWDIASKTYLRCPAIEWVPRKNALK